MHRQQLVERLQLHQHLPGIGVVRLTQCGLEPPNTDNSMPTIKHACRTCGAEVNPLWQGQLLELTVTYYQCDACGYVQTEQPFWLERAYAEAVNSADTGIMTRNVINSKIVLSTLLALGKLNGKVVDYAGGYGFLVRLLRDYGVDALWTDQHCQNLVARGFEHQGEPVDLVTAFEAFEHFVEPAKELDKILAIAPNVLLSTEIITDPPPLQNEWWYYGKEHGQHIGFFKIKTLEKLAQDRGKLLLSDGVSYHLITDKPINKRVWKVLIRANKLMPLLLRHRLAPKTWADHELMAGLDK